MVPQRGGDGAKRARSGKSGRMRGGLLEFPSLLTTRKQKSRHLGAAPANPSKWGSQPKKTRLTDALV
jgi:hypothetical protein